MALCLNRAPVCSKVYTVVRSRKLPLTHGAQGVRPSRSSRLGRAAGSAAEAVAEELLAEVELEAENGAAAKPCSMLLRRGRKRGKTVNTKESRTPLIRHAALYAVDPVEPAAAASLDTPRLQPNPPLNTHCSRPPRACPTPATGLDPPPRRMWQLSPTSPTFPPPPLLACRPRGSCETPERG